MGGFTRNLSAGSAISSGSQKNAKASFRTPKPLFQHARKGTLTNKYCNDPKKWAAIKKASPANGEGSLTCSLKMKD